MVLVHQAYGAFPEKSASPNNNSFSRAHLSDNRRGLADFFGANSHFGFGDRVQAVLLSQIYPLENYLGSDGQPFVMIKKGRKSGRYTKRYLSLRRFQKALGMAPSEESSGDSHWKKVLGGSDLCRKGLWQWVFTRIEVRRNRPKNHIGQILGEFLDLEKASGCPVRLVRSAFGSSASLSRTAARAVKLLFKHLVKALCDHD